MHNQPREPQTYKDCQAKLIQEFGWTSQGMDWGWGQGNKSHHTQTCQGIWLVVLRGVLPGLRRRITRLLPSGPKSSFQMGASFVFNLQTKVLESGGRVEKLIAQVSTVCDDLGCNVISRCWSIVFFENQRHCTCLPRHFGALHASFMLTSFLKMLDFTFPAGFGTCPHSQKHQKLVKWPWCWCAWLTSKLTRPEPHREYMEYCQEENAKQETKKCRWAEGHCQRNLGFHTPQQCHKLINSIPRRIEAVIKAKGAPTKYWVHTP